MYKPIKLLSPATINRIAAGEVIDRPASAIKELVENALDANATNIEVSICNDGGRNLIIVQDNGFGMSPDELQLAIQAHTTSKLDEDDLLNINSFGFRGEALASIACISRLTITSRKANADDSYSISVLAGEETQIMPAALAIGTRIEIKDLFFATPVRLKFLKSTRSENQYIIEIIHKLSLAHPSISFSLNIGNKKTFQTNHSNMLKRSSEVLGEEFINNAKAIDYQTDNIHITGYASLPTYNKGTSTLQYLFVNNRPVKDKLLLSAVKVAYLDYLARDRFPVVLIFLTINNQEVDVNVHPSKLEVRFRDANRVKSAIIAAIKGAIKLTAHQTSTSIASNFIKDFTSPSSRMSYKPKSFYDSTPNSKSISSPAPYFNNSVADYAPQVTTTTTVLEKEVVANVEVFSPANTSFSLGVAKCQLHKTYIVAQTTDAIIIVDQHAAHERLVYENLKQELAKSAIKAQKLLIPEIIELSSPAIEALIKAQDDLQKLGLAFSMCGNGSIMVNQIPLLLINCNIRALVENICDDLIEHEENITLGALSSHILGTYACHHSVRAGRVLNIEEMNQLLRQMEQVPFSGQCNHGRPTYVELKLHDIEKLFGRS
jgi:DNA mismatch repair protein MutL